MTSKTYKVKLKSTFSKQELAKYIILQGTGKSIQKVNSYLCSLKTSHISKAKMVSREKVILRHSSKALG